MKLYPYLRTGLTVLALALAGNTPATAQEPRTDSKEVLVYPTLEEGSMTHWLAISKLRYNAAYIGDSISYDVFKNQGGELAARPREGEALQGQRWRKMHFTGSIQGPTYMELHRIAGGFNHGISICAAYLYSPTARPNAMFSGSSDDGLKVILNGKKIWTNQIQRSPTYDSDQFAAPLQQGWNSLICVVDDVIGGHLLTARFLDGGQPLTDLQIALDPPAADAVRHPAAQYNEKAATLMRTADALRADGKLTEAVDAYDTVVKSYPLADVSARAMYGRATTFYSTEGEISLNKPQDASRALQALLDRYGQDLLAEYALLELAKIQEAAGEKTQAEATYRAFEGSFPTSSLAAKSQVELARLLASDKKFEESILTYRRAIKQYPLSDEVMTANVGIGDAYRMAGDKAKAREQYQLAQTMATDWHDNKYGIDVGKQAWLRGIMDYLRTQLAA